MSEIEVRHDGAVALCLMSPPGGFMTRTTVAELDAAVAALEDDEAVRAIVLAGAETGVFIRHYDVGELEETALALRDKSFVVDEARLVKPRDVDRLLDRLAGMAKPVIAALNGTAMGGGFELALACDLRIAQPGDHAFGLPEIKIGLLPGAGGTQRLARLVGAARALELILRGRTVTPEEALALGLVHELAEEGALARAMAVAAEITAKPAAAVAHIKRLVRRESALPLAEALAIERTLFLDLLISDAAIERMGAMNRDGLDIRRVGGS
ncbi:MAG: enoyl-CoA hydratase/isomerase family protein [Alphaproteobacteria bacterium]|jgi:enoyl-CoA hydratase|nr:enoyl-CoA hydratase/isomerase family protein [Alphaproteobacteria bacterium]